MSKYSPSFPYCNAMLMESVLRRKFIVIFSHAKCIKCIWINYIILLKYYIYSPYNYELILKKKHTKASDLQPPAPPLPSWGYKTENVISMYINGTCTNTTKITIQIFFSYTYMYGKLKSWCYTPCTPRNYFIPGI